MLVSVGIKALNEEKLIASVLDSAVRAVEPFGGEVILADSGSTDRTVEIARTFPVRIFQLANTSERRCGAGAQLAFQHARGEYFYLLDGDMVLAPNFIPAGIAFLHEHPDVAAVGGRVTERNTRAEAFRIQADNALKDRHRQPGFVDRLDGGGLYRTASIRDVGYFSDRNLHGFEEFDLAARLRSRGWKLARIDLLAVDHFGHAMGGYRLLGRRVRQGYSAGAGEVLRAAIGERHLSIVLTSLEHVRYSFAVIAWWLALIASRFYSPILTVGLFAAPFLFLCYRRGSLRLGVYSLASWNVTALGLVTGIFHRRTSPGALLASVQITGDERP